MINKDKKRYVYLDKYLEFQDKMNERIDRVNRRLNLVTYLVMGMIVAASYTLIQIFS